MTLRSYFGNQNSRGKEKDLNKTNKGESHAESQHPSDVGDERCGRHHLGRKKRVNDYYFLFLSKPRLFHI